MQLFLNGIYGWLWIANVHVLKMWGWPVTQQPQLFHFSALFKRAARAWSPDHLIQRTSCLPTCYSILKNLHDWSYFCIIFITNLSLTCGGCSSCRCLSSTRFCAFILCWSKLPALFNIIMKTRSWRGTLVQHVKNNLCCILFCLFFSWLWTIAFINFVVEDNSGDETFAILYFLSVVRRNGKPKLLAEFI